MNEEQLKEIELILSYLRQFSPYLNEDKHNDLLVKIDRNSVTCMKLYNEDTQIHQMDIGTGISHGKHKYFKYFDIHLDKNSDLLRKAVEIHITLMCFMRSQVASCNQR
jgi:hypothetical protein